MTTTTSNAAVSSKPANRNANVVSKSTTANATVGSKSAEQAAPKTQRVLETRDAWNVIFNHMADLVAALAKGEPLCDDPRKGFAFGKVSDQPHSRSYAQSLLAGFVSRKANKFLGYIDGLQTIEDRTKIALAILSATKLGGKTTESAKAILSKAEPKQAKTFSEAVKSRLEGAQLVEPSEKKPLSDVVTDIENFKKVLIAANWVEGTTSEEVEAARAALTEQSETKKAASPKGKKTADGSKGKRKAAAKA